MRDDDDRDLRAQLRDLPRDLPPPRDLWPGVSERLGRRGPWWTAPAIASGLALAAAVALVVWPRGQRPSELTVPSALPESPPAQVLLPGEPEYEKAELALAVEVAERRPRMPPAETRALDDGLHVVDEAIASTRQALAHDPSDPELRAELDRVWQDKLDLLQQVTELTPER